MPNGDKPTFEGLLLAVTIDLLHLWLDRTRLSSSVGRDGRGEGGREDVIRKEGVGIRWSYERREQVGPVKTATNTTHFTLNEVVMTTHLTVQTSLRTRIPLT